MNRTRFHTTALAAGLAVIVAAGLLAVLGVAPLSASDGRQPIDSSAVATGEIVVGESTGHIQGTDTPTISGSVTVGASGTAITQIRVYAQTITPDEVATVVCAEQTFTVTGLTTDDTVLVNPAATGNATSMTQARVSAANTLALMFCNPTAGGLTPGAGTYSIVAIRS